MLAPTGQLPLVYEARSQVRALYTIRDGPPRLGRTAVALEGPRACSIALSIATSPSGHASID